MKVLTVPKEELGIAWRCSTTNDAAVGLRGTFGAVAISRFCHLAQSNFRAAGCRHVIDEDAGRSQ